LLIGGEGLFGESSARGPASSCGTRTDLAASSAAGSRVHYHYRLHAEEKPGGDLWTCLGSRDTWWGWLLMVICARSLRRREWRTSELAYASFPCDGAEREGVLVMGLVQTIVGLPASMWSR
jgi:hypothetical protein